MQVILPDGKRLDLPDGATGADVAQAIGPGLARAARAVEVEGQLFDLLTPLPDNANVSIVTKGDDKVLHLTRHTLAHVMAQAVREYLSEEGADPADVKMGIGPVIENGFYYDFDLPRSLTPEDLGAIEERMTRIIEDDLELRRYELPREEALQRYRELDDPYKVELIEDLPEDNPISFYEQGGEDGFTDLCRGPHVPRTGLIPRHFKLTSVAGAYWRGDEKRPMLQRIYGVAFETRKELDDYLWQLEEAKKRDHRKLGRELGLFTFSEEVGQGLPLWLPKGAALRNRLENFMRDAQERAGYEMVISPHIGHKDLYITSGHYSKYGEDSFQPIKTPHEGEESILKPIN